MTLADAASLLREVRDRGVQVEVVGDRLRFRPANNAVLDDVRERLRAAKPRVLALLHEEALVTDAGDGDRPSIGRCRSCREPDFVRPRAGGAWRCARCRPYEMPPTSVEWCPAVGLAVPLDEVLAAIDDRIPDWDPLKRPCWCCGGRSAWRLRVEARHAPGVWGCARCHPPLAPAQAVEMATVTEGAP